MKDFQNNKVNLNFKNEKRKSTNKTIVDKNNFNNEKININKKEKGKNKTVRSSSYKAPEINSKKFIEDNKNKIKKEQNNNLKGQNKDIEAHKEIGSQKEIETYKEIEAQKDIKAQNEIEAHKIKKDTFFINSINEIRLPPQLYDISYDILQNK